MIKINLLRDPFTQAQAARKSDANEPAPVINIPGAKSAGNKKQSSAGAILLFLIFASLGGLYYYWLDREVTKEQERNVELTAQKKELEPYFQLEQQYREQRESLRKKEQILTKLKKQQQFPVYFLIELANSIPDNVWLVRVNNKGNKVEIRGESLSEDAIYQFRDNLASRPQWFNNVNFPGATRRDRRLELSINFDLMNPV